MKPGLGQTVCETPEYISWANKVMTAKDRIDFIDFIAHNPKAGDIMEKTSVARKVRFARKGQGKSGSYRII